VDAGLKEPGFGRGRAEENGSAFDRLKQNSLLHEALRQVHELTGLMTRLCLPKLPPSPTLCGAWPAAFCRQLALGSGACPSCLRLQAQLCRRLESKLKAHWGCCPAGIVRLAVPVIVAGQHVGTIVGGQVRLRSSDPAGFGHCCRQLGVNGDRRRLHAVRRAFFATRVLSRQELAAALRLLQTLAQLQALTFAQPAPSSPPVRDSARVSAAENFVRQHLTERMTTENVARAAGLTGAYFCRLFRRTTGTTLHNFVANLRVAGAKDLLARTLQPIGQIAFAAGFQSIPDFNRVFRHKTRMSPSQYRRKHYRA